jgi:glycosyltransferase involved in cell wall biosynthesis
MKITAIILTLDEEVHLARCIENIQDSVDEIVVVDAYSGDATVEIAKKYQCTVLQNTWVNHGHQFNWALSQLGADTDWVLRVDADEYMDFELIQALQNLKKKNVSTLSGIYFKRVIQFQGHLIRFGGMGSVFVMRLFKYGSGISEVRWMDEHILVDGNTTQMSGKLIDHNLKSLSFWVAKHNRYADKEAFEELALRYARIDSKLSLILPNKFALAVGSKRKRWIKNNLYRRIPSGVRAFMYFVYRYFFLFGFLDGSKGFAFHFLQGFWYRYLVDLKLWEAERFIKSKNVSYLKAAKCILNIK